jgi:hypothetical protein
LVELDDIVSITFTLFDKQVPDFQRDLLSLISILGRMFLPKVKYQITARKLSVPNLIGRDSPEIVSMEVPAKDVEKFLRKEITRKELWSSMIFFVKESNIYSFNTMKVDFPLMV